MPEPQIYDAATEALFAARLQRQDLVAVEKKIEERDPIWNFEHIPSALQEQTDLRAWSTRQANVKLELVRTWIKQFARLENEDLFSLNARRAKIRRRLLFVIGSEVGGSREIAAEAFKGLFPKE